MNMCICLDNARIYKLYYLELLVRQIVKNILEVNTYFIEPQVMSRWRLFFVAIF